jgi:DNA-binding beta-propeller fold protein YncE
VRVDPPDHVTAPLSLATRGGTAAPSPIGIAATARAVWVLNANTGTVTKIDAELGSVDTTIDIGLDRAPRAIAAAGEIVWVANSDGSLSRIAAEGGRPATIWVGEALSGVASAAGRLWVTTRAVDREIPGGPS